MKLLLTSQGISNKTIENAFVNLLDKPINKTKLTVIPTSSHMTPINDQEFIFRLYSKLLQLGFGQLNIADIAVLPKEEWLKRLMDADIIFVFGGNSKFLLEWVKKSGLEDILPKILKEKIYVGQSAGSMMLGKTIVSPNKDSENNAVFKTENGLGVLDFSIRPHFYRPDRPQFTEEAVQKLADEYKSTFYAIDDDTAIVIDGDKVEVVSEGKWGRFE